MLDAVAEFNPLDDFGQAVLPVEFAPFLLGGQHQLVGHRQCRPSSMTLTTYRIANELLKETLLTLEQITMGVTVLAINATRNPEESPRVRRLLGDLLEALQQAEEDLGTYATS